MDDARGNRFHGPATDIVPELLEVFIVAADVGLGALGACRAHDQPHAVRHVETGHDFLEPLAVSAVCDLAGDAAATWRVRHQNAVAASQ